MKNTSVNYANGVLEINYPSHTKICRDIYSARIALERIIRYRTESESQTDFWYYSALADMVKDCLDQMVVDYEIQHYLGAADA